MASGSFLFQFSSGKIFKLRSKARASRLSVSLAIFQFNNIKVVSLDAFYHRLCW